MRTIRCQSELESDFEHSSPINMGRRWDCPKASAKVLGSAASFGNLLGHTQHPSCQHTETPESNATLYLALSVPPLVVGCDSSIRYRASIENEFDVMREP